MEGHDGTWLQSLCLPQEAVDYSAWWDGTVLEHLVHVRQCQKKPTLLLKKAYSCAKRDLQS